MTRSFSVPPVECLVIAVDSNLQERLSPSVSLSARGWLFLDQKREPEYRLVWLFRLLSRPWSVWGRLNPHCLRISMETVHRGRIQ